MTMGRHVAVIGAGAFGGWTALSLLGRNVRVSLIDAWGPGNSRASSGGETRVIRGTYGADSAYTEMTARAFRLWREYERRWSKQMLFRAGVLWMAASGEDTFERGSIDALRDSQIPYQELTSKEIERRWPQINLDGVNWGIYEPESGYLLARLSCRYVVDAFVAAGGEYCHAAVTSDDLDSGSLTRLAFSDGSVLAADEFVFACGPWLPQLFPVTLRDKIVATKQDVFFFGPPGGALMDDAHLPVWAEHRDRFRYGIPGNDGRGFKIADDTRGEPFDPTWGERMVSPEALRRIREYMEVRFPAMKEAPLLESRVCQYEQTPDGHFILDRHPRSENVWLLGGGSGHGFKHGPVIGELMAELLMSDGEAPAQFRLARF